MIGGGDGACAGQDPAMFDATTFPAARKALAWCSICPITEECLAIIRPQRTWFDGVAGGIVWRNGYRVRSDNTTREERAIMRREEIA